MRCTRRPSGTSWVPCSPSTVTWSGRGSSCAVRSAGPSGGSRVPERGRILANLGAVSLRRGDVGDAGFWADKALEEMDARPGDDPDARLTADWVRLEVARAGTGADRDLGRISDTLQKFDRSAEHSIALKGGDHPAAIAARRALATVRRSTRSGCACC